MEITRTVNENGSICYKNEIALFHREDGPAYIGTSGYKAWYINGVRHREDGPAIIWSDSDVQYYLNDIEYSKEDYEVEVVKMRLKRIIDL